MGELEFLKNCNEVYIVGNQSRGRTFKCYLNLLFPHIKIIAFLVDNVDVATVERVPVMLLDSVKPKEGEREIPVYIATGIAHHNTIISKLTYNGFKTIRPITPTVDNELRTEYARRRFIGKGWKLNMIDDLATQSRGTKVTKEYDNGVTFAVYCANSDHDTPLEKPYVYPDYEHPIHVGASLARRRLPGCILTDNLGNNISDKNIQYCELTALYWAWKHSDADYIGISHYRRHFILPDNWQQIVIDKSIDIIMPVPTTVTPSVEHNYFARHGIEEWESMMQIFLEYGVREKETVEKIFSDTMYFPCNMFIMRREILDDLCEWMFPILDRIVCEVGRKPDPYLNRYPGFISERLISVYIITNMFRYNILYANKDFLK